MNLSKTTHYALRILALMAANEEKLYSSDFLHKELQIPKKYLEQILLMLKRGGYVKSYKGADGGYKLAKKPDQISVAEIIRFMDGALAPVESVSKYFYEHTPVERSRKLLAVFKQIRDYISDTLENVKFSDLL